MRVRCIAVYTAKVPIDHVASFAKGASQMQMSVAIGPYGSYDPVETPKPRSGDLLGPNCLRGPLVKCFKFDVLYFIKCPPPPPAPLTHTHAHTLNKATKLFTTRTRARTLARTALDCTPQHADSGERERGARRHSRVAGALRTRCGPHRLPQLTPALTYPCAAAALGSE